jgi:iron complex outermembrane receptor protein
MSRLPFPVSGLRAFRVGAALLAGVLASAASPAFAQQAPPEPPPIRITEEVVVTASVTPLAFDEVARAVSVVFGRDLDWLGIGSVADALRLVAGVDPRARGPRDVQTDFAVRGATFGQSLVLLDGTRLNDSQSGHHNGDIPVPVVGIDRIEVLAGPASAVHGADALGGTINILSRRGPHTAVMAQAGEHGLVAGQLSTSGRLLPDTWTATAWASRSGGFTFDREFAIGGAGVRGAPAPGWRLDLRHQRKAFGAAGFYGDSPSKEWTDQTLAAASWQQTIGAWTTTARGLYRNHGDHFLWDINRPGFAENRHRTNAGAAAVVVTRALGGTRRLTFGADAGADAISSSNLGDHRYGHGAGFVEYHAPLTSRATVQTGLRLDGYSTFGHAWSPSFSASVRTTPSLRLRASAARAFRIPTYTERFYRDPAHEATSSLRPERGWAIDAGADWTRGGWLASGSVFRRWDEDVIDWVKRAPEDMWNTTNVRDVATTGVELSLSRSWREVLVRATATALDVDAPSLTLLSKYVLEYATRSISASVAAPVGGGLRAAVTVDYRHAYGGSSRELVGVRVSRAFGRATLFADASNLFDEDYVEVPGVEMPGRWITAGLSIR